MRSQAESFHFPFGRLRSLALPVLMGLLLLNGCLGRSLGEVRATVPLQTRTYPGPYQELAACTKTHIETDSWSFGQPAVHSTGEPGTPLMSISTMYAGSALFEVTFQPAAAGMTLVKYRRGYDGYDSKEKTWAIIDRCSQQPPALSVPFADISAPSSLSQAPGPASR